MKHIYNRNLILQEVSTMRRTYRKEVVEQDKLRQQKFAIQQASDMLQVKKQEQQELQKQLLQTSNIEENRILTLKLDRCESAITKISSRLKNLGIEEKRGRPKKADGERYQEQRKKFTAHLQMDTLDYLQQLKANGAIANISAFVDELVAEHQKKNSE